MFNKHNMGLFKEQSDAELCQRMKVDLGDNSHLIDDLIHLKIFKSYKNLANNFNNLPSWLKQSINDVRFLLCLSGEEEAFNYAVTTLNLDKNTVDGLQQNALHYAALSGKPILIDKAIEELHISWDSASSKQYNLLHYAILSKNIFQLGKVLLLEKNQGKELKSTAADNINILHLAASTGIPELVDETLKLATKRNIPIDARDNHGLNTLDYANSTNNQRIIKKLENLGLSANSQSQLTQPKTDFSRTKSYTR